MSKPTEISPDKQGATVTAEDLPKVLQLNGRQNSQGTISLKAAKHRNGMFWVAYSVE